MKAKISPCIQKGVAYIIATQNPDGSFTSYIDTENGTFREINPVVTVFNPCLILSSLSYVPEIKGNECYSKLIEFVASQRNDDYTYNYWPRESTHRITNYCPDDIDDTFCAYNALLSVEPDNITPDTLVAITRILIATEAKTGGPYRTWIVSTESEDVWLDVDPAVNANAAYFLSIVASIPNGLQDYIENMLNANTLQSAYYFDTLATLYYLSRCPNKAFHKRCVELLPPVDKDTSSLNIALSITILLNAGQGDKCKKYIDLLLDKQRTDGSWAAAGFSIDRVEESSSYYSGCAALTTAFALEALARYREYLAQEVKPDRKDDISTKEVLSYVRKIADNLPDELRQTIHLYLEKMQTGVNGKEILKNATMLNNSLKTPLSNGLTLFPALGSANLYGWIAYTIYDDFIDDEGEPRLLPAANTAHRISFKTFLDASPNKQFQNYVEATFDKIDAANAWEVSNCRAPITARSISITTLPDYRDLTMLAYRSIGHTLPPLAIMAQSGDSIASKNFTLLEIALQHYLIAKQLNDDAHDWMEDFTKGHLSYVVTKILQEMCASAGVYNKAELQDKMQHFFWHNTILTICDQIEHHILSGEAALRDISSLRSDGEIFLLFKKLRQVLIKTRKEREDTLAFLKSYNQ